MLAAKRLNMLEHPLQGSIVESGAQGGKIVKESPCLVGRDTPFPLADEQGIENLGASEGRHQGLVSRLQQIEHAYGGGGVHRGNTTRG
jgi:hypothetical protein